MDDLDIGSIKSAVNCINRFWTSNTITWIIYHLECYRGNPFI